MQKFSSELKKKLMRQTMELAKQGGVSVLPNPLVGALLAMPDGKLISQGWHKKYSSEHAEVEVLKDLERAPPEAALFVNLEPCNHQSQTPPCVDIIIAKKVKNLVYGCLDPNPQVNGSGIAKLKSAGVNVEKSQLTIECQNLNRVFFYLIKNRSAYLAVKAGITLDGKIALANFTSKWITNQASRAKVQYLRSMYQALAVGKNTLMLDNPRLNLREVPYKIDPVQIVFSSKGDLKSNLHFTSRGSKARKILIVNGHTNFKNTQFLIDNNIELLQFKNASLKEILAELYKQKIFSILLEGGQDTITRVIKQNQANYLHLFIAPKLIGKDGINLLGDMNFSDLHQIPSYKLAKLEPIESDIYLEYIL